MWQKDTRLQTRVDCALAYPTGLPVMDLGGKFGIGYREVSDFKGSSLWFPLVI